MGKVKKPGEVTDVRSSKVSGLKPAPPGAGRGVRDRRAKSPPAPATKRAAKGAAPRSKPTGKRGAAPARKPARGVRGAKGGALESSAKRTGGARRGKASKKKAQVRPQKPARVPVVSYRIKELDPFQKCGSGTSVQSLYRVDESVDGALRFHLVFFDRHGWYCEHGRNCPAVTHARKFDAGHARQLGRN